MAVKVQYVLLMKDQSYYVKTGDDGHLETTLLIYEAHHFDTRWEALVQAAQSKLFAYATIHPHRQEIPQPVIGEFADWPAPDPEPTEDV